MTNIEQPSGESFARGFDPYGTTDTAIVGNTEHLEHTRQRAHSERQAQRKRETDAESKARGGLSASLDSPIGQRLTEGPLRALARNAETARKVEHRIRQEQEAALDRVAGQLDRELLEAAWDAGSARAAVPPILEAVWEYDRRCAPPSNPIARAATLIERAGELHAEHNRTVVQRNTAEIETILTAEAVDVIDSAAAVYRTLIEGTGAVDDATAVIANGTPDVLAAFQQWPSLVTRFGEVVAAEMWVRIAETSGFDARRPTTLSRTDAARLEQSVWTSHFAHLPSGTPRAESGATALEQLAAYATRPTRNTRQEASTA